MFPGVQATPPFYPLPRPTPYFTPAPIFSSSHHTTTGLVTRGKISSTSLPQPLPSQPVLYTSFFSGYPTPWKMGDPVAHPTLLTQGAKTGVESLLGAFQRGWSPDTAALCTSQPGQRPLSQRLHIVAFTGVLCSYQPEQYNEVCPW